MFLKFAEESALYRAPGQPGPVPVFSLHGSRIYDKIVEVYRCNKRKDHNGEFTQGMHPPRNVGYDEHQEYRHCSTKYVRTYKAAQ